MVTIPEVVIRTGDGVLRTMPVIGMGTAISNALDNQDAVKSAILQAIKIGYRHFDTAAMYKTEQPLGRAIQEALVLGLIKSRDELFITTKLWCDSTQPQLVLPAIHKSLQNLGLKYVDLYLIHWPLKLSMKMEEFKVPIPTNCISAIDIKSVWEAMEECQNLGHTKAIGVSNFSSKKLQEILSIAKIPPAVNQVEMNPLWQQKKLRDFCKEKGIILTAYCPLGAVGNAWGDNRVMQSDVLVEIAKSKGKTTAQWLYDQGVTIVPKSFNKERMKENIQIFDWSLSEEESNKIGQLPQHKGVYLSMMAETSDLVVEIDAEI